MTHTLHQPRHVLRIEVAEGCAIFSGAANLHRFDEPTAADIAASVRGLLAEHPTSVRIEVAAEDTLVKELRALLTEYNVEAASLIDTPASAISEQDTVTVSRLTLNVQDKGRRVNLLLIGVVGVVILLCAVAIWFVMGRVMGSSSTASAPASPSASPSTSTESSAELSSTPAPAPETVTLSQDGLSVELPAGFALAPDEDMWRATGSDPDLRIQFAVDPLYGVPTEAVMGQIEQEITEDPELTLLERVGGKIRYRHVLPDGSEALWVAWAEHDYQISIGCHSRTAPTTIQLAACTMANDTARFNPP
ncbi:type VII secretion-associated protein [Corynebacterium tuscaniense]|uniref:type VII secretion-associated protein n=1 Tax=Corynebacterium tuscaniense TaxID=302449 RepID=UPI001238C7C3|nr:type VII secretion-associated protein [Corynebacterium tuscaniense]KAA8734633.1 type VII secretion-associated protein [Corynebacterium tuscaniense]